MPFFFMLYSVIRGITNTVSKGVALPYTYNSTGFYPNTPSKCGSSVCALPRYVSPTSKMYHSIVVAHGELVSGGINFAAKLLSHHSSPWVYIPYALLVLGAVGLQYLQMSRLNARNPQANQANPQAAMIQKYMPLIFGFIYLNVAAILNVYFIVSSAIRIGTQEVLFRRGIVPGPGSPAAGSGTGARKPATPAIGGAGKSRTLSAAKEGGVESSERAIPKAKGSGGSAGSGGTAKKVNGTTKGAASKATAKGSGSGGNGSKPSTNGNSGSADDGAGATDAPKPHPRSKAKKERKAR
jgi:hypothetical protein